MLNQNFLYESQAIKKQFGNETLKAVFHGPYQLLILFKNFPFL